MQIVFSVNKIDSVGVVIVVVFSVGDPDATDANNAALGIMFRSLLLITRLFRCTDDDDDDEEDEEDNGFILLMNKPTGIVRSS